MHFVDLDYTPSLKAMISSPRAIFYGLGFLWASLGLDGVKGVVWGWGQSGFMVLGCNVGN